MPPVGLVVDDTTHESISLSWMPVPLADLEGYRVYFDSDSTGFPYDDTLDVGNVTSYTVGGLESDTTYRLAVTCYDRLGNEGWYSAEVSAKTGESSGAPGIPNWEMAYHISAYPNPFTSRTEVLYALPAPCEVRIAVHDVHGRLVKALVADERCAGKHRVSWDGKSRTGRAAAPGVYYLRFIAAGESRSQKIVLIR
jgi:hypothetical protein